MSFAGVLFQQFLTFPQSTIPRLFVDGFDLGSLTRGTIDGLKLWHVS